MLQRIPSGHQCLSAITFKGTDHAASLEPDGIRRLKRNLENAQAALKFKSEDILPIEQVQRDKLKYRKK